MNIMVLSIYGKLINYSSLGMHAYKDTETQKDFQFGKCLDIFFIYDMILFRPLVETLLSNS